MKASHTIRSVFDDPNVVSDAGLVPVLRLAESAGLHDLLEEQLSVASPNATAKATSVVGGMLAGADSIDDLDLLRHGGMPRLFSGVRAPSTLGTFLRSFTQPVAGTALISSLATVRTSRQSRPVMCSGDGALSGRAGAVSPGRPRSPISNAFATAARPASPFLTVPPSPVSRSPQSSCPHVPVPSSTVPASRPVPIPLSNPAPFPSPPSAHTSFIRGSPWPLAVGARP